MIGQEFIINKFGLHSILSPEFKFYQFITHMFLHGGITHIVMNMIFFISFGSHCEEKLGSSKFLSFYLISGVVASLCHMFVTIDAPSVMIGASGAVFSVFFFFTMMYPNEKVLLFFIIPFKAKIIALAFFVAEVYWGLTTSDGIAHFAHVGGALSGIFVFLITKRK